MVQIRLQHMRKCLFPVLLLLCLSSFIQCPQSAANKPARLQDLDDWLLDLISELSVNKVSSLCRVLLRRPPSEHDLVHRLAELGKSGEHEANQERDLHRFVNTQSWRNVLPDLYEFSNFLYRSDYSGARRAKCHVLLPHEVFHTVWEAGEDLFDMLFRGGNANLQHWWDETRRRSAEWHDNHPAIQRQPDPLLRVPIGTHGDDTSMHQHDKVLIITWNSVSVSLDTLNNRIVFAAIQLLPAIPGITLYEYYLVLQWSLNALSAGEFPAKDGKEQPSRDPKHTSPKLKISKILGKGYFIPERVLGVMSDT